MRGTSRPDLAAWSAAIALAEERSPANTAMCEGKRGLWRGCGRLRGLWVDCGLAIGWEEMESGTCYSAAKRVIIKSGAGMALSR